MGGVEIIKTDLSKKHFLLHINDPTFPIGAFSHTFGLETYLDKGLVYDEETLYNYLVNNLKESFLYSELLAFLLAYKATEDQDIKKIIELDLKMNAFKSAKEIREASQKLGNRLGQTLMDINSDLNDTIFSDYLNELNKLNIKGNFAIVNAVACASVDVGLEDSLQAFTYSNASGIITNAVKSVPLKQTTGQKIMVKLYPVFDDILSQVLELSESDYGLTNPGLEIRSMQHEILNTRLYIS